MYASSISSIFYGFRKKKKRCKEAKIERMEMKFIPMKIIFETQQDKMSDTHSDPNGSTQTHATYTNTHTHIDNLSVHVSTLYTPITQETVRMNARTLGIISREAAKKTKRKNSTPLYHS